MIPRLAICTVILMKLFSPAKALAATCYDVDDNGTKWYKNLPNAKGVYPNSLYTASSSKKCSDAMGIYIKQEPVEVPPLPTQDYTGQEKVWINPSYTNPADCTYLKVKFNQKLDDGSYTITQQVYDAAQFINGVRTCPYK